MSEPLDRAPRAPGGVARVPADARPRPGDARRLPDRAPSDPAPRPLRARRSLALALAASLLLGGAAFAITPSRHAILDVLGLRGVRIERVPHLPPGSPAPRRPGSDSGSR